MAEESQLATRHMTTCNHSRMNYN